MITIEPNKLVGALFKKYREHPSVTPEELEWMKMELQMLESHPAELTPPAWMWMLVEADTLLRHAQNHRPSLSPEECASMYRRSVLIQQWRLSLLGEDRLSDQRARWLPILGRLTAETSRGKR
jgi:hypothetical protein